MHTPLPLDGRPCSTVYPWYPQSWIDEQETGKPLYLPLSISLTKQIDAVTVSKPLL